MKQVGDSPFNAGLNIFIALFKRLYYMGDFLSW
jgi:hypothetical protein